MVNQELLETKTKQNKKVGGTSFGEPSGKLLVYHEAVPNPKRSKGSSVGEGRRCLGSSDMWERSAIFEGPKDI